MRRIYAGEWKSAIVSNICERMKRWSDLRSGEIAYEKESVCVCEGERIENDKKMQWEVKEIDSTNYINF